MRIGPAPADSRAAAELRLLEPGRDRALTNKFSNNLMARQLLSDHGRGALWAIPRRPRRAPPRSRSGAANAVSICRRGHRQRFGPVAHARVFRRCKWPQVLSAADHSRYAPEFLASLPLAGVDGTLRSRMKSGPAGAVRLEDRPHRRRQRGRGLRHDGRAGKPTSSYRMVNHAARTTAPANRCTRRWWIGFWTTCSAAGGATGERPRVDYSEGQFFCTPSPGLEGDFPEQPRG